MRLRKFFQDSSAAPDVPMHNGHSRATRVVKGKARAQVSRRSLRGRAAILAMFNHFVTSLPMKPPQASAVTWLQVQGIPALVPGLGNAIRAGRWLSLYFGTALPSTKDLPPNAQFAHPALKRARPALLPMMRHRSWRKDGLSFQRRSQTNVAFVG